MWMNAALNWLAVRPTRTASTQTVLMNAEVSLMLPLTNACCVLECVLIRLCVQAVIRRAWAVWEADLLAVRNAPEGSDSQEQSVWVSVCLQTIH